MHPFTGFNIYIMKSKSSFDIFDLIDEVVIIHEFSKDGPGKIIYTNKKATEVLGYSKEEFLTFHPYDLGDPSNAPIIQDLINEMKANKRLVFKENLLHKDGHRISFEMRSKIEIFDQEELSITICKNVNEYVSENTNLKQLYNELEFFFESMPNFIFTLDVNYRVQYINRSLCEKIGISKDEIINKPWSFIFVNEEKSLDKAKLDLANYSAAICYSPIRLKSGNKLIVETILRKSKWRNQDVIAGTSYDLTNAHALTEQLKESEQKYKSLFDSFPNAIAILSEGTVVFGNKSLETLSGYSLKEIMSKSFMDFVHPSEQAKVFNYYIQRLKGTPDIPSSYETIGIDKYGNSKFIKITPMPYKHNDKPAVMVIIEDTTAIKKAEKELKKTEVLFSAIVNNQNDGVIITDFSDNVTYANPAANQIFGYKNHDGLKGKPLTQYLGAKEFIKYNKNKVSPGKESPRKYTLSITNALHKEIDVEVFSSPYADQNNERVGVLNIFRDVSDERRILKELKESKASLESVIYGSQVGIWKWNVKTGETEFSERWANLIGYSLAELGQTSIDTWIKFTHPDDMIISQKALEKHFKGETEMYESIVRMKHKNGNWVWIQDRGRVVERCEIGQPLIVSGIHHDITELIETNTKLEQRNYFEKLVSEISGDLINIYDDAFDEVINRTLSKIGFISNVDRSYIFLFNDDLSEMTNTHEWCADGIKPEIQNLKGLPSSVFPYTMNKLSQNEVLNIMNIHDLPDEANSEKEILAAQNIISVMIVPLYGESKLLGYMGFDSVKMEKEWNQNDIDLLKTVAYDIAGALVSIKTRKELSCALEKAKVSDRLKSAFLATMNHELRTPLNHIIGFSDIIASMTNEDETLQFSQIINKSGKNLLEIIEDVFDLALAEQSTIKIRKQSFSGIDIFMENKISLEEILSNSGKSSQVSLIFKPQKEILSQYLTSDRTKISQVLSNLFKNAVKFTDNGQIEFGFHTQDERKIIFYVNDTGIGVPEDKKDIIFEFFRQADETHTRRHDGVGIGLAISLKIANAMDGRIYMTSEIGKGSTFFFEIPIEITAPKPTSTPSIDESKNYDFNNKTILVAEDDADSMKLLKLILKPTGCKLIDVINGQEAVDAFMKNDDVDLVIMDLKMPVMDGYSASAKIKSGSPNIPIIALSSYSLLKDKDKALAAGCNVLVSKPVNKGIILAEIAKHL